MGQRTIIVDSKTIVSGVRRRDVLDAQATTTNVDTYSTKYVELQPNAKLDLNPTQFFQMRASSLVQLKLNGQVTINTCIFITQGSVGITLSNTSESPIQINLIFG